MHRKRSGCRRELIRPLLRGAVGFALLCLSPALAVAGGQLLPGLGSQAQPRAGAFHAKADDPTALYYNPAGFVKKRGTSLHLGLNLVDFDQRFQRTGTYRRGEVAREWDGQPFGEVRNEARPSLGVGRLQGIPTLAAATDFGLDIPFRLGFGIFAAHAYPTRDFAPNYTFEDPNTPPPPQRYDVMHQDGWAVFPSLALGWRITDELSVGVRGTWGFGGLRAVTYTWATRNFAEGTERDGVYDLEATDNFIPTYGVGVLYRPARWVELGASYRSGANIGAKGAGDAAIGSKIALAGAREFVAPQNDNTMCGGGGTVDALRTCIDFKLPQELALAVRWIHEDAAGRERADIEFDVQWEDWSSASDIRVRVDGMSGLLGLPLNEAVVRHGLRDTFSFRLGGAYNQPLGDQSLAIRGGVAFDTAAAPLSWTRASIDGAERVTFGGGLGWEVGPVRFDAGAGFVWEPDRTVDNECSPTQEAPGCSPAGEHSIDRRQAPDPVQPLQPTLQQTEYPVNAGRYQQHYLLLSIGLTAEF